MWQLGEHTENQRDQVGIRCQLCAHINYGEQRKRASAFPSKLGSLYQMTKMVAKITFQDIQNACKYEREIENSGDSEGKEL